MMKRTMEVNDSLRTEKKRKLFAAISAYNRRNTGLSVDHSLPDTPVKSTKVPDEPRNKSKSGLVRFQAMLDRYNENRKQCIPEDVWKAEQQPGLPERPVILNKRPHSSTETPEATLPLQKAKNRLQKMLANYEMKRRAQRKCEGQGTKVVMLNHTPRQRLLERVANYEKRRKECIKGTLTLSAGQISCSEEDNSVLFERDCGEADYIEITEYPGDDLIDSNSTFSGQNTQKEAAELFPKTEGNALKDRIAAYQKKVLLSKLSQEENTKEVYIKSQTYPEPEQLEGPTDRLFFLRDRVFNYNQHRNAIKKMSTVFGCNLQATTSSSPSSSSYPRLTEIIIHVENNPPSNPQPADTELEKTMFNVNFDPLSDAEMVFEEVLVKPSRNGTYEILPFVSE